jgi:hypothetical protein
MNQKDDRLPEDVLLSGREGLKLLEALLLMRGQCSILERYGPIHRPARTRRLPCQRLRFN